MEKFITTEDPATAELLKAGGFTLLSQLNGHFVFLNEESVAFEKAAFEGKPLEFTNTLYG